MYFEVVYEVIVLQNKHKKCLWLMCVCWKQVLKGSGEIIVCVCVFDWPRESLKRKQWKERKVKPSEESIYPVFNLRF